MEHSKYLLVLVFLISFNTYSEALAITGRRSNRGRYPSRRATRVDAETSFVDDYLMKYGYLGGANPAALTSYDARHDAIRSFQRMAGLPVTGRVDGATVRMMRSPRCGMPDTVPVGGISESMMAPVQMIHNGSHANTIPRPANFFAPGAKWDKNSLTWKMGKYSKTSDLSQEDQWQAMHNALKMWSDQTPLTFTEVREGEADINIDFEIRDHGDGNAFDGPGGVLAHAYFPRSGVVHIDDEEEWTLRTSRGRNLLYVALHEFGHTLGLAHSKIPSAVMAPFIGRYSSNLALDDDDIDGIQSLYGTKLECRMKFDAVMKARDGKIYIFRNSSVWRVDPSEGLDAGYPKQISSEFPGAPNNIDAAVASWMTPYTYFFKDQRVWKFLMNRKKEMRYTRRKDYPQNMGAAFVARARIILLAGSRYWTFDESNMDLAESRAMATSDLIPGVPHGIDAAVTFLYDYTYFFTGDVYYKYSLSRAKAEQGYPKPKAVPWMGRICSRRGQVVPR